MARTLTPISYKKIKKFQKNTLSSSAGPSSSSAGPLSSSAGQSSSSSAAAINTNECCVCYRTFEEDQRECTGSEWVECVCKRWLHEGCVCDIE